MYCTYMCMSAHALCYICMLDIWQNETGCKMKNLHNVCEQRWLLYLCIMICNVETICIRVDDCNTLTWYHIIKKIRTRIVRLTLLNDGIKFFGRIFERKNSQHNKWWSQWGYQQDKKGTDRLGHWTREIFRVSVVALQISNRSINVPFENCLP